MKKLTAALLIALMILALVGCDNDPGSNVIDVGTPVPTEEPVGEVTGLGLTRENGAAMGMIAAGDIHSAGLRTDGSVLTAGHGYYAQRETADWSGVAYIAAGAIAALRRRKA